MKLNHHEVKNVFPGCRAQLNAVRAKQVGATWEETAPATCNPPCIDQADPGCVSAFSDPGNRAARRLQAAFHVGWARVPCAHPWRIGGRP